MSAVQDRPGGQTGARGGRARAAVLLGALAALTALVHLPTWLTVLGTSAAQGAVRVGVAGTSVAPSGLAAALVLLAAAGAVGLVGRAGRWVVVVVVACAGVLVLGSTALVLRDVASAVRPSVVEATGVGALAGPVAVSPWPWVALVVGVAAVLAAVWLAAAARGWSVPSRRYESTPRSRPAPEDERAVWDALSRGDDPARRAARSPEDVRPGPLGWWQHPARRAHHG
ncbi:Trp biosynthesis-associated membrane protein [Cellulomonas soli]